MTDPLSQFQKLLDENNKMALQFRKQEKYDEAVKLYEQNLDYIQKVLGPDNVNVPTFLNNIAAVYNDQGKHQLAVSLNQRALAIRQKVLGPTHLSVAGDLTDLAFSLLRQDETVEAEKVFLKALDVQELLCKGVGDMPLIPWMYTISQILIQYERYSLAIKFLKRAVEVAKRNLAKDDPDFTQLRNLLTKAQTNMAQTT